MAAPLPTDLLLNVDPDLVTSQDPADQLKQWNNLAAILKRMYTDLADAINLAPEYAQGGSAADPAQGSFQVWKDGSGNIWLAYNDGGTVKKMQFDPPAPPAFPSLRIPHILNITNSSFTSMFPGFFISLPTGVTAKIVKILAAINYSTSITCSLSKNGSYIPSYSNIVVPAFPSYIETTADVTLSDKDFIQLERISSNLSQPSITYMNFTVFIEYQVTP